MPPSKRFLTLLIKASLISPTRFLHVLSSIYNVATIGSTLRLPTFFTTGNSIMCTLSSKTISTFPTSISLMSTRNMTTPKSVSFYGRFCWVISQLSSCKFSSCGLSVSFSLTLTTMILSSTTILQFSFGFVCVMEFHVSFFYQTIVLLMGLLVSLGFLWRI